jgi:2-polyprenyl-3-methyl-5-hydroxy-6-metoxy-1,4-benzoquinol methylase
MRHRRLKPALAATYEATRPALPRDVLESMAVPSYLHGNALSRLVFWRKLSVIVGAARLVPGSRVLDFGCGSGVLLPRLQQDGRRVLATDEHLEFARDLAARLRLERVEFIPANAWQAAIPDGTIETIIAANVLEHIENRRGLLADLVRKLAPTGRLVVSGPTENALYRLGRRIVGFTGAYHVADVFDVLADIDALGLRRASLRRWPLPGPLCLYQVSAFMRPDGPEGH